MLSQDLDIEHRMPEREIAPGELVHLYDLQGNYLGKAVFTRMIPIEEVLATEDMLRDLPSDTTYVLQEDTFHFVMEGSEENMYGIECTFDIIGPTRH